MEKALAHAKKQHAASAAVVAKGVQGKYQALRQSQVSQWAHTAGVLERLLAPLAVGQEASTKLVLDLSKSV